MNTQAFNPVSFLESKEEIAQYLNEAYEDDNPEVFVIALGNVIKARGVSDIARKSGLNRESLYKIFSGKAKPQWGTIHTLMHTLGFHINTHTT
ncbi:MAG: putative addiction module antidote protein [Mariprofundaceae bacterium]|nr:putative addiction module antidote protein [Mariprofundaceae bacterium]